MPEKWNLEATWSPRKLEVDAGLGLGRFLEGGSDSEAMGRDSLRIVFNERVFNERQY